MQNSLDKFQNVAPARIPRVASPSYVREIYHHALFQVGVGIIGILIGLNYAVVAVLVGFYSYWRAWKLEQLRYTVENRLYCPLRDDRDEFNEYELQAIGDKPFCFSCHIPHMPGHCVKSK